MSNQTTITIAIQHPSYRQGILMVLQRSDDFVVKGSASNLDELAEICSPCKEDVLIIDFSEQTQESLDVCKALRKINPHLIIVGLALYPERLNMIDMRIAGIQKVLPKNIKGKDLLKSLELLIENSKNDYKKNIQNTNPKIISVMEKNLKVLIVDDDIDVITMVETILKSKGIEVISANGKEEGMEKMLSEKPDLAILDVMMNTTYEGFELAKAVVETEELKEMPIMMQTSIDVLTTTNPSIQTMAHEFRKDPDFKDLQVLLMRNISTGSAGVDYLSETGENIWFPVTAFLRKPVDAKNLISEIERICNVSLN
jgi:DNA-binding NarL/FixJ family response regulator